MLRDRHKHTKTEGEKDGPIDGQWEEERKRKRKIK